MCCWLMQEAVRDLVQYQDVFSREWFSIRVGYEREPKGGRLLQYSII